MIASASVRAALLFGSRFSRDRWLASFSGASTVFKKLPALLGSELSFWVAVSVSVAFAVLRLTSLFTGSDDGELHGVLRAVHRAGGHG